MLETKQFCTFYLDGHYFGIGVLEVQEVFRYQEMTKVPLAPGVINGLINLRGQIITAIDLRLRLGIQERPEDQQPMNVVVRTGENVVSLLVDEIGDVREVSEETYESAPDTISENIRELISGVYKLENQLLLILDTQRVLDMEVPA
jgi:purine-binding chemotaxis protein CheW